MSEAAGSTARERLGGARSVLAAWALVAIVDAVAIALGAPPRPTWQRALHHLYDAGQCLSLGVLSAAVVLLRRRVRALASGLAGAASLALIALALGAVSLRDDLDNLGSRLASSLDRSSSTPVLAAAIALVSAGVPLAWAIGRALDRPRLRWIGAAIGLAAMIGNHLVLRADYPGAHLFMVWAGAVMLGASLAGATLPARIAAPRPHLVTRALLLALSLATLANRPDNRLIVDVLATHGAPLTPILARRWAARPDVVGVPVPADLAPWFVDRGSAPAIAPTVPVTRDPIVLLLFIDALRADVLADPRWSARLPALTSLGARSVRFTRARSPGSQTVYTFSAVFASRYFSQMYWSPRPPDGLWPHEDTSPRFPEILARAGVPTVTFASARWLINTFGVVRGFTEEAVLRPETTRKRPPPARDLANRVIARLKAHQGGPLFVFVDFMDAHAPYDRGGTDCAPFECYVREVAIIDEEIARIEEALRRDGLADRTTIVITSDHGDAFGEHGTTDHSVTLYEELIRVPLLIRSPGAAPRAVDAPVSLVDLGPTILDLMGEATPGSYMGQSLVPILRGGAPALTRPIVAEGRLKQALVLPDQTKVIRDQRRGTVEVYDLARDPRELTNLSHERASARALLDAFFRAQTIRRPGYTPPYRP